jgi:ATP/maltotriose-dependent transcriptional regulator MalT
MRAVTALISGDPGYVASLDEQLTAAPPPDGGDDDLLATNVAQLYHWTDRLDDALAVIERILFTADGLSALTLMPMPLTIMAEVQWKRGEFARARAAAERAIELCRECQASGIEGYASAVRARVAAAEGDEAGARANAEAAVAARVLTGQGVFDIYVNCALGLLELGMGRHRAALDHLDRNVELWAQTQAVLPTLVPWQADHVQVLLAVGEHARASAALEQLEDASERSHSRWGRSVALRCRAMLEPKRAAELCHEAIRLQGSFPFERARTLLVLGDHERRAQHVGLARRAFDSAAEIFSRCGARPWLERADSMLRSTGVRRSRLRTAPTPLTEQELQVALLIADGATNKQAAAALFLSTKTVEYHLGKAFRKLGVQNRTQLARHVRLS